MTGAARIATCLAGLMACLGAGTFAQDHSHHAGHRMTLDESGMVMNENRETLPRDCEEISRDYRFEVSAGTRYAEAFPGAIFSYDRNQFEVEPCSRIEIVFNNEDEVRHQWMVHGLPRYLYPGGMFHLEAAGGHTVNGTFIVPGDARTYLVHCDITQHMEKGMKGQLKVAGGSGDLWAIPGISSDFRRPAYLPADAVRWLLLVLAGTIVSVLVIRRVGSR